MKRLACITLLLLGCGTGREQARDEGATHLCAFYQKCGHIGAGQMYIDLNSCLTEVAGTIDVSYWPTSQCENKIDPSELSKCLTTIDQADCMSGGDILNVVFNACPSSRVCDG